MRRMAMAGLLVAAGAGAGLASPAAQATALSAKTEAHILGPVRITGADSAEVRVRYVCQQQFHFWVSAKQVASRQPDQRLREEGSSQYAASWMDGADFQTGTALQCDGAWHTDTFALYTDKLIETSGGPVIVDIGRQVLQPGQAWMQFCVVYPGGFLSSSRWAAVL